ncbi:acetyl-CoA carboxylase biotin carboxyl carrier protein [Protofrankia symbiont of Coriaria ruscifolia]|uniref:acetyl-CoA carboxylase biotin carboxyl carrier protein n=1 Tax=Protofrankia symbiont of Coriaria ruscifolia TaxID=1306542 RepID=UPI0010419678|nr:biotin/lipoyl-containing protein [Protofrankia symbiont of Coriaria ruscifolia]
MRPANAIDQRQHVLRSLHEHATRLAGELPGQLGRIRVCSGDVTIEVEWSQLAFGVDAAAQLERVASLVPALPAGNTSTESGSVEKTAAAGVATGNPADSNGAAVNGAGGDTVDADVAIVTAPIVGTFYHAPEPGAEPFVAVGNVIDAGATIGIIEAMKLLNPVTADIGGTVARICVGNGEAVEFDQVLVEIAP